MSYYKMALVRPDLLEKNNADKVPTNPVSTPSAAEPPIDAQKQYYLTQLAKERLSPTSSLVQILSHLQKTAHDVLNDSTLDLNDKLRQFNQLMVKTSIIMDKAKRTGTYGPNMTPAQRLAQGRPIISLVKRKRRRREDEDSDVDPDVKEPGSQAREDEDTSEDEWADTSQMTPPRQASGGESSEDESEELALMHPSTTRDMDANIERLVPETYQGSAKGLYRLLAEQGGGKDFNWTRTGEIVVGGRVIKGTNLIELLTDAARKKSRVKPPVGRDVFVNIVKRLNPNLRHVKNKVVFKVEGATASRPPAKYRTPSRSKSRSTSRSKSRSRDPARRLTIQQSGSGKRVAFTWRTRL